MSCRFEAEQARYLYLKATGWIGRRFCACGSGERVQGAPGISTGPTGCELIAYDASG